MGIRIQPRQLDIPEDDPFKNDLLDRKESASALTNILGTIEGPCVFAIEAEWGTGKTTFLNMWTQHLQNEGFQVVSLNAWETDFTGDPFLAISSEVTGQLSNRGNRSLRVKVARAKAAAAEVAFRAIPAAIRVGTAGLLDVSPILEKELGQFITSYATNRLAKYDEAQASVARFRNSLQEMASTVSSASGDRPLIILIDELDRCRPTYAVEFLEIAKHLFSVDHLVFVAAVNRKELAHSIRAIYGERFDSEGYLHRFFDVDFRLPNVDRRNFIRATADGLGLNHFLERTEDKRGRREFETASRLLTSFLISSALSLRSIEQMLKRFGLIFASLKSDTRTLVEAIAVALLLTTLDFDTYRKFIRGEIQDLDVADAICGNSVNQQFHVDGTGPIFEALLILAGLEIKGYTAFQQGPSNSPLWGKYNALLEEVKQSGKSNTQDGRYAQAVLAHVEQQIRDPNFSGWLGFGVAIERLELLSNDLADNHTLSHSDI